MQYTFKSRKEETSEKGYGVAFLNGWFLRPL